MPNEHESTFHDHLHQGDVLRDEGQLAEAESAYKAALAVDPADTNAHYKLFDLYLKMGREHEAMHELDRLPEKKWDFSQATPAFVPESEPEIQETQYEEAEAAPRESPAVQPLGAGSESVSAPQEPLPPQSPDTTPDLDRPPRAFSEATPLEDAWTQPEVLVPEKPPQAVYEQERQRDQVEPVEPVEPVETGEAWEIDQPSRLAAAEIPHTASEQNVASAQIPDQAQHSSGHSLFNLPEDDAEEEFEAVEQEFAEEFAEDFSEDTFPQEATKKSRLSSMFSSLSSKIGRRNNQDEYDGPYEEYEQDEDYEQHDGQYESAELDGHNKYDGQNAYGEHDAPDTHDEYDEYDEYDDMDPVLLDDRPPRPWWHWLAGLGILATLLYAAWQFFFAAPLPAPSSPAPSSSQGAETDPLSQSFYPTGEAADRSDFSEPAVQDPSVPASPDTPPEYSREYSQEYPQENLGKYPEETVSPVAPLGTESSLGGAASQDVPAPSSVVSQNAAAEPASFFTEAEALSQPGQNQSVHLPLGRLLACQPPVLKNKSEPRVRLHQRLGNLENLGHLPFLTDHHLGVDL
jgi:tetratricopeptide (TPR) repeat protein